jgi:hypothetical protein
MRSPFKGSAKRGDQAEVMLRRDADSTIFVGFGTKSRSAWAKASARVN